MPREGKKTVPRWDSKLLAPKKGLKSSRLSYVLHQPFYKHDFGVLVENPLQNTRSYVYLVRNAYARGLDDAFLRVLASCMSKLFIHEHTSIAAFYTAVEINMITRYRYATGTYRRYLRYDRSVPPPPPLESLYIYKPHCYPEVVPQLCQRNPFRRGHAKRNARRRRCCGVFCAEGQNRPGVLIFCPLR